MAQFVVLIATSLAVLADGTNTEESDMVWPETKVNVSESYLPPVVQVLSYLMEEINGLAPVPESSETTQSASSSSATSEATESASSSSTTSEATESVSSSTATSEATEMASSSATISEQTETTVETTAESSVTTEDLAESSDGLHNSSSTTEALSFSPTPNSNDSTPATDLSESANHTVIEEDVQNNTEESATVTATPTTTSTTMPSTTEKPSLPYAMLGRLRDVLANEGKRQGFSKIQGFSPAVEVALVKSSHGTSVSQLRTLVCTMLDNSDIKRTDSITHSKALLAHLNNPSSILVNTLENVPPLMYSMRK